MGRPRKSAAAAQYDGPSSSQDGQRGTRRKRRTSADSVIDDDRSQRESTQQSDLQSIREESNAASDPDQQRPRKKRVKRVSNTDSDQLTQELQHAVEHDSRSQQANTEPIAVDPQPQPQQPHRRVRFSDPGPPISAATPTHSSTTEGPATPQARNPAARPNRRVSLPATFGNASPDGGLVQFTPLRAVLEDRKRRRLRRWGLSEEMNNIDEHKREDARTRRELQRLRQELREKDGRVTELIYELEVQRQFAIEVQEADRDKEDEKVKALENQLDSLRNEIAEQKERHEHDLATIDEDPGEDMDMDMGMGGPASDDEDNAGFMLIEPEDINIHQELSQLPDNDSVSNMDGVAEATQTDGPTDAPDPSHEIQIQQFEEAIAELSKEASEAKAALQILSIELQTLGFTESDANAYDVLTSLRSAFQHIRNEVEAICPGESVTDLENGPLVYSLVEKIRDARSEMHEKLEDARKQSDMNNLLNNQNKGLVNKMAEFENRRQTLEGQWHELDVVSEKKTKEIIELEEELEAYKAAVDERDAEIVDQDKKMDEMEVELTGREEANERLQEAINSSREEVASLQELIGRVEEESINALEKLKEEHAAAIAELEQKLATEQLHREQAEQEIDEKTSVITQLEVKIEAAETDLDQLRDDLAELQELKEAEKTQREAAEEELDDRSETITELEQKVESTETELDDLRGELEKLRDLGDAEREQLEAAMAEVEEKDDKIAELETKIHDAGMHANDLRQKLFELQVQKQAVIEELQDTAAKREEQYNQDIAAEIARREDAEQIAADRSAEIADLQTKIDSVEENIEVMTIEKDDLISELEKRVDKLEEDLIQLREEYNSLADQKALEIQALHDDIAILNADINQKAEIIEKLQTEAVEKEEAHQREVQEKEARITTLSGELDAARTDIQSLEENRNSLEHRVENEAAQMLDLQNMHANEIDSLRNKIDNHEAEIDRLRRALELREDKYTSDINNKNKQLESLQLVADTRLTSITALENQVDSLKRKFRDHALSSRKTMATLAQSFIHAAEDAQNLTDRHAENAEAAIRDVEDLKAEGLDFTFANERVNVLKQGGSVRRPRRQFDSGFGVAEDEDMLEETMA